MPSARAPPGPASAGPSSRLRGPSGSMPGAATASRDAAVPPGRTRRPARARGRSGSMSGAATASASGSARETSRCERQTTGTSSIPRRQAERRVVEHDQVDAFAQPAAGPAARVEPCVALRRHDGALGAAQPASRAPATALSSGPAEQHPPLGVDPRPRGQRQQSASCSGRRPPAPAALTCSTRAPRSGSAVPASLSIAAPLRPGRTPPGPAPRPPLAADPSALHGRRPLGRFQRCSQLAKPRKLDDQAVTEANQVTGREFDLQPALGAYALEDGLGDDAVAVLRACARPRSSGAPRPRSRHARTPRCGRGPCTRRPCPRRRRWSGSKPSGAKSSGMRSSWPCS